MRRLAYASALLFVIILGIASAQTPQQQLDQLLLEYASPAGPAIVVQVTSPDGSWTASAGSADGTRATTPDDRFRIASTSKTFVAVAALLLVEDRLFALDDRAADWLPQEVVERVANTDTVTIRQLLAMRGGIEDYLGEDDFWVAVETDPSYAWTAAEVLEVAYDLPPLFAPDTDFYYSNTNYILLQLILEEAAQMPLHALVRQRILEPLGMENTYTQVTESLPGGFVRGYADFDEDGRQEDVSSINDGAGLGDGGLISSAADLTTFYRALFIERSLLSEAMMAEILNFQADDEGAGYSLGLSLWDTEFGDAWGHSGAVLGFNSLALYLPDAETILVILGASDEFDPEQLAEEIAAALFD